MIVFYPTIWPDKTKPKCIGFQTCPEEIQAPLIDKLETVLKKPLISKVLWKTEENKELLQEIMRQSLSLHVNLDDTIRKSIGLYHYLYLESSPPDVSQEELLKFRTEFVRDTAAILTSKATWEGAEVTKRHETLCHEVVKMFKNMFLQIPERIDENTREQIFYTLLSTASDLLAPQSPNPPLAEQLHGVLLDTILFLWICTKTRNTEHWDRLCKTISGLFHNMHTVVQVSDKMMQMTMVVVEKIYYVKTVKKKKTAKRPGMMGGDQSAKHMEPKSPDSESPPVLPPKDELIWGIKWTFEEALYVWRSMLQLFQNANTIRSPSIHVAVLKTLWMVISLIMWKEDHVPYQETLEADRPEFLRVIDLFGPLLFSACDLPESFVDGKAEAYKILCRMFCRHHIRPLPNFLLSHFYAVLQQGLVTRDSKNAVQNEILRNSSNIFNLGLSGSNLLIPYYLQEIRRVLTGEGRSTDVKERAVIILCSLICFSSHFGDTEIPAVSAGGGGGGKGGGKDGNIHEFLRIAGAGSRGPAFQGAAGLSSPFPMTGLLNEVVSILTEALKMESVESLIGVRLIWGVAVAVFELVHSKPSNVVLEVNMLVLLMLKHLSGPSKVVVRAGIHAVTSLSCLAPIMREVDANVLNTIVESISGNIIKEMNDYRTNKCHVDEALLSDQLFCLLEWVLALGDFITNDVKVVGKVCEALEVALMSVVKSDLAPRPKSRRKSMRPFTSMDESLTEMYALVVNVDAASVLLPQVREAAENVVLHLLHFLHNVPGREGIEVLSSLITHNDDLGGEGTNGGAGGIPSSVSASSSPMFSSSREKAAEKEKEKGGGERRGSHHSSTSSSSATPPGSSFTKDGDEGIHVPKSPRDSPLMEGEEGEGDGGKEEGGESGGKEESGEKGGEGEGGNDGESGAGAEKGKDQEKGDEETGNDAKEETKEGGKEEGKERTRRGAKRRSSTKTRKGGSRTAAAIAGGKVAKEGGRVIHFVHNDNVVMSFVEVKHPERDGCFARVIIRDSIGKYTWDTDVVFDYEGMGPTPNVPFPFTDEHGKLLSADFVSPRVHADSHPPAMRKKNPGLIPSYTNKYTEETDQLEQLLDYLTLKFPDCLVEEGETALAAPSAFPEAEQAKTALTEEALVEQLKEDRCARLKMEERVPPPQVWQMEVPATPVPKSPYHFCRMLLSHIGFLSESDENLGSLALILGDEEKIRRGLNQLDLTNGREMVKVGIIYLKEGQEEQLEVLRNDSSSRSPLFYEFVRSLGWPIDIPTHRAYLAGLDPKMTTGETAPYFASSTFEMVFHDLTSMPTTDDPQQIHKKRHVGNDNIHVIWSEHLRDYNPRTIVSEFNDAHIVLYPLPNGLFKVHIYQKENVDLFGPLMHGMCVTKGLLAILIRQTSLMANKYVRYTHEGYVTPFTSRRRVLAQMVERHKAETTYRQFLGNIIA